MITRTWFAFILIVLTFLPGTALADKRVALLIGNAAYAAAPALKNPPNDVALMKAAFQGAGFDKVLTAADVGRQGMIEALRAFADEVGDADIAVVYFSGHGLEMNGENYLVPVDARLAADRDVADETVSLGRLMQATEGAHRLRLVILDACRNNPFLSRMAHSKTRALSRGLARPPESTADTLVAFAAKEGTEALDGDDANSPFAAALARRLVVPGVEVEFALRQVRDDVLAATKNRQEPFKYGSLGGQPISLAKGEAAPQAAPAPAVQQAVPPAVVANPCADAAAHWAIAEKFNKLDFYQEHLRLFGACPFAGFAKVRIEELSKVAVVAPPPPLAAPATTDCDRLAGVPNDPSRPTAGVPASAIDAPRAIEACRSALAQFPGTVRLQVQLARALAKAKQYEEAAKLNRDAADKGDVVAMNNLAFAYGSGQGVPKDEAQALKLYRQAADQGYLLAMVNLASSYEYGRGVPRDEAMAAQLYQRAIDAGSAAAMTKLGFLYARGIGVNKDEARAVQLFQQALDKGDNGALINLGTMYLQGSGVKKDPRQAVRFFRESAEKGDSGGMFGLANMYTSGLGVQKDYAQGASWWIKSISAGNDLALSKLIEQFKIYPAEFRRSIQSGLVDRALYFGPMDGKLTPLTIAALKKLAGQ